MYVLKPDVEIDTSKHTRGIIRVGMPTNPSHVVLI